MKTITFLLLLTISCFGQEKERPFFQARWQQPYHLSVGAVVFDEQGRIGCHHFDDIFGHSNIYILMRESVENGETPLETLERGLKEEFGATAEPVAFLGSLCGYLPDDHLSFEKTTLYIACRLLHWTPEERDPTDPEAYSTIKWIHPDQLILLMQEQGRRFPHRIDADESEIIQRAISYIRPLE